ncbi:MAG: beta-hydroxyacyl-ACP dehydratase [Planctomycetota bacterium]
MPPKLLFDPSQIDIESIALSKEDILEINPQRHEFEQLDWICHFDPDPDAQVIVGVKELREDDFWVRGHMPERPIFPGVLMLESAAQLCSVYSTKVVGVETIFGFGGADQVRFRRTLDVGERFVTIARPETITPRRSKYQTQGLVDGKLVFEATILGIALPSA